MNGRLVGTGRFAIGCLSLIVNSPDTALYYAAGTLWRAGSYIIYTYTAVIYHITSV